MRWRILRTLLHKEALRHLANRGGIVMVLLLLVASMLLSFFGTKSGQPTGGLMPSVQRCYVDYDDNDAAFVAHLRNNVSPELVERVRFRRLANAPTDAEGRIVYAHTAGAIQLRPPERPGSARKVWVWYPGDDDSGMAPYETWFWKESARYERSIQPSEGGVRPSIEEQRSSLAGGLDPRSGIATSLVLFGLFFVCVYLLPSMTCEERERGVLLAQALSPASTAELLAARFIFYPRSAWCWRRPWRRPTTRACCCGRSSGWRW